MTSPPEPVVTVNATIMDGTIVSWYRSNCDAERQRPVLSASREGVKVASSEDLTSIPEAWISDAKHAYEQLRADHTADMSAWATHQQRKVLGTSSGPLEPVKKEA